MVRALLWVLGGLLLLVVLVVVTAPELLADLQVAGGLAGLAFAAAVPGTALLGYLAIRRRGRHDGGPSPDRHDGGPSPDRHDGGPSPDRHDGGPNPDRDQVGPTPDRGADADRASHLLPP